MGKKILKVIEESDTGRNIEFQDTRNNHIMSDNELIGKLRTGNSTYNEDYFINYDKNGKPYVQSKPDGNKDNNLN